MLVTSAINLIPEPRLRKCSKVTTISPNVNLIRLPNIFKDSLYKKTGDLNLSVEQFVGCTREREREREKERERARERERFVFKIRFYLPQRTWPD